VLLLELQVVNARRSDQVGGMQVRRHHIAIPSPFQVSLDLWPSSTGVRASGWRVAEIVQNPNCAYNHRPTWLLLLQTYQQCVLCVYHTLHGCLAKWQWHKLVLVLIPPVKHKTEQKADEPNSKLAPRATIGPQDTQRNRT
jgi:hypothetical protein